MKITAMKTPFALTVCAALLSAPVFAQQQQTSPWYLGIDLGASRTDMNGGDINGAFASQGITSSSTLDRSDNGFGLKLGYRLSPRWSLEGGYHKLGKFGFGAVTTAPAAGTIGGNYEARAWSFSGLGSVPIADKLSLYGKLGVARTTVERDIDSQTAGVGAFNTESKRNGLVVGAGATYDFSAKWFGRAGWDRYTRVGDPGSTGRGDIDFYSIGFGRRF
jgi:OmpA-OmpF porin, OOP family